MALGRIANPKAAHSLFFSYATFVAVFSKVYVSMNITRFAKILSSDYITTKKITKN